MMRVVQWITSVVGSVVSLAACAAVALWCYRAGWIERLVPPQPVLSPVTVRLNGPSIAVRGDRAIFRAEIGGRHGEPVWRLEPPVDNALFVFPDGKTAEFRCLEEGQFTLHVSVGGDGRQVASDLVSFENLSLLENVQQVSAEPMPQAAPPPPTIGELVQAAVEQVQSADKAAEARVLAGCIQSVIGRIQTGLLAPDADPLAEIDQAARVALGARYDAWDNCVSQLAAIVGQLRDQGSITTAATCVAALSEMSAVLLHTRNDSFAEDGT